MEKISEGDFNRLVERLAALRSKQFGVAMLPYSKVLDYLFVKNEIFKVEQQVLDAIPVDYWGWIITPTLQVAAVKQGESRCLGVREG